MIMTACIVAGVPCGLLAVSLGPGFESGNTLGYVQNIITIVLSLLGAQLGSLLGLFANPRLVAVMSGIVYVGLSMLFTSIFLPFATSWWVAFLVVTSIAETRKHMISKKS